MAEQQFEAGKDEAGRLISGTVAEWHAASEEAKNAYSVSSAMALSSGGESSDARAALGSAFRRCMETEVARAAPNASLGDVSYECAMALTNAK